MESEIEKLKSVLRSLVVSSPTQVTVFSLLRDYKNMIGAPLPITKYGHKNPVEFLKDRCSDCFLIGGPTSNPVLTLIVPNSLKHIDKFVQCQKSSSGRHAPKRRSVLESVVKPAKDNLIVQSFKSKATPVQSKSNVVAANNNPRLTNTAASNQTPDSKSTVESRKPTVATSIANNIPNKNCTPSKSNITPDNVSNGISNLNLSSNKSKSPDRKPNLVSCKPYLTPCQNNGVTEESYDRSKHEEEQRHTENEAENTPEDSRDAVRNFLKKRLPMLNSYEYLYDNSADRWGQTHDDDSGRHTSSSSSGKAKQLDQLKSEIMKLISDAPDGVWCTDLIRLYRERYNHEMNFSRFGFTSILSLVYCLEKDVQITRPVDTGDWLLQERVRASAAPPALRLRRSRTSHLISHTSNSADPEEALPGIDFDPDVFPEDCMHFMESIDSVTLNDFRPGAMVEVMIGEVYSPSHFWFIRLGDNYNIAMEDMMDDMARYYNHEGRDRVLARGAVRVGHYCSTLYEKDWHRSLIVKIVDSDTVKVRHVDYGTVDTVAISSLKPLRKEWSRLPAQAARARLAGVRPPAAGWRWPRAAAAAFLQLVSNRRLVANVVALDQRDMVAEVLLIDTSSEEDVCIGTELIRAGHADTRPDSALRVRHVDYGTVDTVAISSLKPLRKEWSRLPAQAARARLAGVRPPAAGWRWPRAAAAAFLQLVSNRRLVANVVALDQRDMVAEVLLIDTSSEEDVCIGTELIRAGHADTRPDSALRTLDVYLYPRFEALESGATPNYAEIHAYLRDGIALDYVEEYRAHVPVVLTDPPVCPDSSPDSTCDTQTPTPEPILDRPNTPLEDRVAQAEESTVAELPTRIPLLLPDAPSPTKTPKPSSPKIETKPEPTTSTGPPQIHVQTPPLLTPPSTPLSPHAPVYIPGAPYQPQQSYSVPPSGQFVRSPPPPYGGPPQQLPTPSVTLSLAECETYRALSHVNPAAAHWFIVGAMGRTNTIPAPQRPMPPSMHPPHPQMFPSHLMHSPMHPMHPPMHPMYPPVRIRPPPGFGS